MCHSKRLLRNLPSCDLVREPKHAERGHWPTPGSRYMQRIHSISWNYSKAMGADTGNTYILSAKANIPLRMHQQTSKRQQLILFFPYPGTWHIYAVGHMPCRLWFGDYRFVMSVVLWKTQLLRNWGSKEFDESSYERTLIFSLLGLASCVQCQKTHQQCQSPTGLRGNPLSATNLRRSLHDFFMEDKPDFHGDWHVGEKASPPSN